MEPLEEYFSAFRQHVIGLHQTFESPFGVKEIVYADWTASGRAYRPIEEYLQKEVLPFMANTHTGASATGTRMSEAYEAAKSIIKGHVHAGSDDVLIFCGSGMTSAVNKLQRILGLKIPERIKDYLENGSDNLRIDETLRPVVFVTHMEHHSNHISWLETIATVEIIKPDARGNVDMEHLRSMLEQYKHKKYKIAAITACSNVTGIQTPYHAVAKLMHAFDGLCFVDYAASAPYVHINMHPAEQGAHLDAIYFSGHKFLGGAGTPGILVFNKKLYRNQVPDQPGGGTIIYSNPWKVHEYTAGIEQREDGGTPPILQGIKAGMCIRLKEIMGVDHMLQREKELVEMALERFSRIRNIKVLQENATDRLGIISFIIADAHYNLIVKLLNDRFGVQVRGGCSCAGTYGHFLLQVEEAPSYHMLQAIRSGNLLCKPGWIRLSLHPVLTNAALNYIMDAIEETAGCFPEWAKAYAYDPVLNEYLFKGETQYNYRHAAF
ncbi:MAG TPA: aminotransferase class V-fold PLP-dependent enzyme [Chitinophaga sp.]|uniref:aminotransferase class V-fold PLP-dependent enzyme n=1 Tax=Chitinophaga sp. TaxID=1869181 RepID=UPI002DB59D9B|nr:aminotransferase class V-fold PLP-dependent enzyme [Chitinophaga sp.]HEU4551510.1 aminotransferase class V-fold PLP-dependent enzyme [Chitinophaga sp.]